MCGEPAGALGGRDPLALRGEVVWANRQTPRDMGIRFTSLDERKVETLKQYIHKVQRS